MERNSFRSAILRRDAGEEDGGGRLIELSFSSEEPYRRWFGTEILSHEKAAIDLSRLEEIGVLLFNHDWNRVIGKILSVDVDAQERKCRATVEFDTDEDAEVIFQKVCSGTLKGVSVGYEVNVWEDVEEGATSTDGRFQGPCSVAVRWMPYEISIVSVPADMTVGVGRSMKDEEGEREMDHENQAREPEKREAPLTAETQAAPAASEKAAPPAKETHEAAIAEERRRTAEILATCRQYGMEPMDFISKGATVEQVRSAALEKLAAESKAVHVTVGVEEMDKFRAAAADGLALRAGIHIEKPAAGADEFRGKRMLRLAAECVERETGENTRSMDDKALVRAALTGTGAFPGILSNVANKSMMQSYQEAPTTYQIWTAFGSNSDFKDATRYRLSEADDLEIVNEAGEFKNGSVTEASVKTSLATYGKTFSLTRQAIINDDMGALSTLPSLYGASARRLINKMVYKLLTDNPVIEGAALFHRDHNNLAAVGITIEGLGKMKAAMARQKNIGNKTYLNIQPAYLIVPVELEVTAAQLISSVVDPTKANATPNPFANRLTVVSEPELADTAAFYLASAPGYAPTIEVTHLNGNSAPVMESAVQFDTLGIKWRIYEDVGVNLLDYRGLAKSTGENG